MVYVIQSCSKGQSELERTVVKNGESLSDSNTDAETGTSLATYRNHQLDLEAQSDCKTDNTRINEISDTQEVNVVNDSASSFKNSTSITLTDNENDILNNIFEKLFKTHDIPSIENSWRTVTIFSKGELIYTGMTKLNMNSELFVTGGFRKSNILKKTV